MIIVMMLVMYGIVCEIQFRRRPIILDCIQFKMVNYKHILAKEMPWSITCPDLPGNRSFVADNFYRWVIMPKLVPHKFLFTIEFAIFHSNYSYANVLFHIILIWNFDTIFPIMMGIVLAINFRSKIKY